MKVYGPYLRKDGRKHVCIVHADGTKQTKSYPRFLIEQHLGKMLTKDEEVDHINNDYSDNRLENLQVISGKRNREKEMEKPRRKRKLFSFICSVCGKETVKYLNTVKSNKKRGCKGPFCSRVCAGKGTYINPWA